MVLNEAAQQLKQNPDMSATELMQRIQHKFD